MQSLVSPYDSVHGCELNFPDTAFIDSGGKITEIIKTDKEGFIISIKQPHKLKQQAIRRNFTSIIRERRRATTLHNEQPSYIKALKRVKEKIAQEETA